MTPVYDGPDQLDIQSEAQETKHSLGSSDVAVHDGSFLCCLHSEVGLPSFQWLHLERGKSPWWIALASFPLLAVAIIPFGPRAVTGS